jgi:hypothetical protein
LHCDGESDNEKEFHRGVVVCGTFVETTN